VNSENNTPDVGLSDLVHLLRRGFLISLFVGALAASGVYYLSSQIAPRYRATVTIIAAQTTPDANRFNVSLATPTPLDGATYRVAALSYPVLSRAFQQISDEPMTARALSEFRRGMSVRVEESRTSSLIYITAESDSAELSAEKANAMANALVAWDKERATDNLQLIIDTLRSQINALNEEIRIGQVAGATQNIEGNVALRAQQAQQLTYAETLLTSASGLLRLLEPALTPYQPVSPRPTLNAALAFAFGIGLTYVLLLVRDALSIRFRSTDEVAALTRLPVLAEFPRVSGGTRRLPQEAINYLRTNLLFLLSNTPQKTLLVTSALISEGKSSVALSLAESFARNGYNTLLIDADLRKPVIAKEYELDARSYGEYSLDQILQSENPIRPLTVSVDNRFNFRLYPTFQPVSTATEVLSRNFQQKLKQWREEFEVIIIDSAPLLPVADTLMIAPLCTGTILVTGLEKTDKKSVRKATEILGRMGVNIVGIAATQSGRETRSGRNFGFGYGRRASISSTQVTRAPSHKSRL
jgi:succinoglycan biosynthesis transport protein ExoP